MADEGDRGQDRGAGAARAGGDVDAQRGGPQADQISGETPKGAHNNRRQNSNPSGNPPNQNQSARQEGGK